MISSSLLLAACSAWDVQPEARETTISEAMSDQILLVNRTQSAIYYFAWEADASNLMDPQPHFSAEAVPFPRVEPQASAVVDQIHEYSVGADVRFFLYTGGHTGEDGAEIVKLDTILTITHEQLQQNRGRVVVDRP